MSIAPQKVQSLAERAVYINPPPPPLPIPSLCTSQGKVILINEFICICLSLLYVKLTTKQILTNVISTKIKVHFCCFMACYWLSSLSEESFLPDKVREMTKHSNPAFFLIMIALSNWPHFLWVYRRNNPLGMLGKHEKVCKSRAKSEWFTSFSNVLPTSQVGYHADQPIESVVYCFYKITLSKTMSLPAQ